MKLRANEDVLDYLNKEITSLLVEVKGLELGETGHAADGLAVPCSERHGARGRPQHEPAGFCPSEDGGQREVLRQGDEGAGDLGRQGGRATANGASALPRAVHELRDTLAKVEQVEEEIDQETEALRDHHVERLKNKKCSARNGMLYLDMLTNLERIGDHAENIATSVDKETPVAAHGKERSP